MSNDYKLAAILVSAFFLLIAVLIMSVSTFYSSKDKMIAEMVKNGADPILASCALDKTYVTTCELYFVNKR